MALSNVALTDTYDVWRVRTNQLVALSNLYEANNTGLAYSTANAAYVQANTGLATAQAAYARGNTSAQLAFKTVNTPANNIIATTNTDTVLIRGGNDIQITGNTANQTVIIQNDRTTVISAFAKANTACTQADQAGTNANNAYGASNNVLITAQAAYLKANSGVTLGFSTVNTPASSIVATSNNDTLKIRGGNDISITGNSANQTIIIQNDTTTEIAAFAQANAAYIQGNTGLNLANTKLANATGTVFQGDLFVTGDIKPAGIGNANSYNNLHTGPKENVNIQGVAANGTINLDVLGGSFNYYTANSVSRWTPNFRGNSTVRMDQVLSNNQSMTVSFLSAMGSATTGFANSVNIDSVVQTVKWSTGRPTAGSANGIDAYAFTIMKTGFNTYTVLASVTSFS